MPETPESDSPVPSRSSVDASARGEAPASPKPIVIPERYNYIAVFLTLACNLRCSYCINAFAPLDRKSPRMTGADWIAGLNRIVSRPDLPVTLQGGEPSVHPDFIDIVNGIRPDLNIDVLRGNLDTRLRKLDEGQYDAIVAAAAG